MNLLICSDIHANYDNLILLDNEIKKADYLIFLGDYTGYNKQPNEVIEYLRNLKNAYFVLGNHDYYLINNIPKNANDRVRNGVLYSKENITKDNLEWLKNLDIQKELKIENKTFLIQHGSPDNPIGEYIYPDSPKIAGFFSLNYDFVLMGHTHHCFLQKQNGHYIINPGSIGQARDIRNSISYATYSFKNNEAEIKRIYISAINHEEANYD